jgi:hypothetical protein
VIGPLDSVTAAAGVTPTTSAPTSPTSATSKTGDANKAFEQLLVQQMTQEMFKTLDVAGSDDSGDGDDSGSGSSGTLGGAYASMLPTAMADAIEQAGGLGLDFGFDQTASSPAAAASDTGETPS